MQRVGDELSLVKFLKDRFMAEKLKEGDETNQPSCLTFHVSLSPNTSI